MKSRIHLVTLVVAVLAGSLVPAAATSPAAAQEQTSWYVNDNPDLNGPSRYWYRGDAGRGYGSNNYRYTYAIGGDGSADNWARWHMGNRIGRQEIQVYVPNTMATATVTYRIDIGGSEYTRRVAQRNAYGWTSLGNYDVDGSRVTITLRDNDAVQHWNRNGYAASSIGVDAARMRCVTRCSTNPPPSPPPAPQPAPPPASGQSRQGSSSGCGVVSLGSVGGPVSRSGDWTSDCMSGTRSGRFARLFEFSLSGEREVTIDLESSDADTYLFLSDARRQVVADDDDGGSGTNSQITRTLRAGTYRVEATTYGVGESGRFTLGVSAGTASSAPPPPSPQSRQGSSSGCGVVSLGSVGGPVSRSGDWTSDCMSGTRSGRFARLFEFSLSGEREVTIDLESSDADTYLFLSDARRQVVADDDDGGSGTNSQITRTLRAGTYRVEATTYGVGESGRFTLGVSAGVAAQTQDDREVTISLGVDRVGCSDTTNPCRWLSARFASFAAGRYPTQCYWSTSPSRVGMSFASFTTAVSSRTVSRLCYFNGTPGRYLTAVVDGIRSNTIQFAGEVPDQARRSPERNSACDVVSLGSIPGSESRDGAWSDSCLSGRRSGRYARLFEFSLSGEREVTIDLESAEVDTFVFLLDDGYREIESDDDGGDGTNSRITMRLGAGSYHVEATTYSASEPGDFTIRVRTSIFNTEIEQILSRIGQIAVATFAEAVSGAKDVARLESRLQGTNTGDETTAYLTRQASLSASSARSRLANIEAEKRELIQVLASVLGVRNDENSVRNPPSVLHPDRLNYSEQVLSSLDHMVEAAEANVVWTEWSRIVAGSLCTSIVQRDAQATIDDVGWLFVVLRVAAILPAAKQIIVDGLRGLAEVAVDQIAGVSLQWVLDKVLPEPIDIVVDAVVFLEPPDPPASLRGSDILNNCYYENGIRVWLSSCSDRSRLQAFWEDWVAGSNCIDD